MGRPNLPEGLRVLTMKARMQTRGMLIAALFCFLFLVSCVEQGDPGSGPDATQTPAQTATPKTVENPGQLFRELVGKAASSDDYLIVYQSNSSFMESMAYSYDGDIKLNIGIFKKKGKEKMMMEMRAAELASVSINRIGDKYVMCQKGDPSGYGSDDWDCQTEDTVQDEAVPLMISILANKYAENFNDYEDYTVDYVGEKNVLDRKCQEFELEVADFAALMIAGYDGDDEPDLDQIRSQTPFPSQARIIMCLDEATGHELYSKVMSKSGSELLDDTYDDFATTVAKRFEQGIDDSEFDLPVLFSIEKSANDKDELLLFVRPYQPYEGPAELKFYDQGWYSDELDDESLVNSIDLGTIDLEAAELHRIMVEHGLSADDSKIGYNYWTYELCMGDECATDTFYISNSTYGTSSSFDCLKLSLDEDACEADEGCRYSDPYCVVDYSYNYQYPKY